MTGCLGQSQRQQVCALQMRNGLEWAGTWGEGGGVRSAGRREESGVLGDGG